MSPPLLFTKLFAPALRANRVDRSALVERLVAGLCQRLTLVSAPAGFGKSTLLAELAAAAGHTTAWVSLDVSDSDPKRWLSYVVAALQRAQPECLSGTALMLDSAEQNVDKRLLTLLLNELAVLPEPVLLVLDDYHLIERPVAERSDGTPDTSYQHVDDVLVFLIGQSLPHLHLAIASREDPGLPLARWRARGELNEVRAADLRFSLDEAERFFRDTMKLPLDNHDLEALDARTEGWIAGLQLAALSLQHQPDRSGFIREFTGSNRFVLDYLAEEVLHNLEPAVRQFLLQTSILDRISAGLAEALTGMDTSREILAALEQNNLFLVPLDDQRQWYRYHHLFADVLRSQRDVSEQESRRLHRLASDWFHQQQMPGEAIDYAGRGSDWEQMAYLLEYHWPTMRFYATEQSFLDWMSQLPEVCWQSRPVLSAHYGFTLLSFDFERGKRLLDETEQCLASGDYQVDNLDAMASVAGMIAVAKVYIAGVEGRDDVFSLCQQALAVVPEDDAIWRGSVVAMLGLMHWAGGELDAAASTVSESLQLMAASGDTSALLSVWQLLADIRTQQGYLDDARVINQQGLDRLHEMQPPWVQGCADTWVMKAEIELECNQLDEARQSLDQAEALGITAQVPQQAHRIPLIRARLAQIHGDLMEANHQLELAERLKIDSPSPDVRPLAAWKVRLWLQEEQLDRVRQWAETTGVGEEPPCFIHEFSYLTWARLQIAEMTLANRLQMPGLERERVKRLETLSQQLEAWLTLANDQQRPASQLDILLLQLECAGLSGHALAIDQTLQAALQIAADRGLVRRVLDAAVWRYVDSHAIRERLFPAPSARVQALLDALLASWPESFSSEPSLPEPSLPEPMLQTLDEPLSGREQEVLALLDSDLTGPQIADRLFVSLNTFRTHNKHIYAKLGVKTRRAAVQKAVALGLL